MATNQGKYNVDITNYDKNGNIKNLNRYFNGSLVDGLKYTYKNSNKSNQLESVVDAGADSDLVSDYTEGSGVYTYDSNGNMKQDPAKGTTIKYNYLNLPQEVKINDNQKIFYHYDAAGNKLAKYVEDNTSSDHTTDYIANIVYTDGQKSFFSTEEGRAVPILSRGKTTWRLEYTLKDHLGNTRVTFGGSNIPGGDIVQTSSYYPFGMVMTQKNYNTSGTNYQQNKYLYNGKEIQDDVLGGVSLDWYDYGARMYDPTIGRFHTVDLKAELFLSWSPYNYGLNNPVRYEDIGGMGPGDRVKEAKRLVATDTRTYKQGRGKGWQTDKYVDCSEYAREVAKKDGYDPGINSRKQAKYYQEKGEWTTNISEVEVGDFVFWKKNGEKKLEITHTGIVIKKNKDGTFVIAQAGLQGGGKSINDKYSTNKDGDLWKGTKFENNFVGAGRPANESEANSNRGTGSMEYEEDAGDETLNELWDNVVNSLSNGNLVDAVQQFLDYKNQKKEEENN